MADDQDFEAEEDIEAVPEQPIEEPAAEDLEDLFRPEPTPAPKPPKTAGPQWVRGEDGKLAQS